MVTLFFAEAGKFNGTVCCDRHALQQVGSCAAAAVGDIKLPVGDIKLPVGAVAVEAAM